MNKEMPEYGLIYIPKRNRTTANIKQIEAVAKPHESRVMNKRFADKKQ
jgi:hypothetical protein